MRTLCMGDYKSQQYGDPLVKMWIPSLEYRDHLHGRSSITSLFLHHACVLPFVPLVLQGVHCRLLTLDSTSLSQPSFLLLLSCAIVF